MQLEFERKEEITLSEFSFSKAHDPLLSSFRELSGRIGILGGSFDPPHLGHLSVAKAAMQALQLNAVVLMPTSQNPLKKTPGAPAEHRLGMLKAMLEDEVNLFVSPLEIQNLGPSYTVDTLKRVQTELSPGSELFFIIGSDTANGLSKWESVERLPKLATFVTVPRAGIKQDPYPPIPLLKLENENFPSLQISSTEIRERLLRGDKVPDLPAMVQEYISAHGLYRNPLKSEL